jgi:hypothetical protein
MPWRGTWGRFDDGRSKLSALARRIEKEYRQVYAVDTLIAARRVRQASKYAALAEQTLLRIGLDKKATRRAVVGLQAAADRLLAQVEKHAGQRNGHPREPLAPSELMARLRAEADGQD